MDRKNVLVIGSGGREHAIAHALSSSVDHVYVAPGNGGTANQDSISNVNIFTPEEIVQFVKQSDVTLVVVGPEVPLADGVVDILQQAGIPAFGPTKAAAQIESSKAFSKSFMIEHGIPTAAYAEFSDYAAAAAHIEALDYAVVVKADGLAAGKGVFVCDDKEQAKVALKELMVDGMFGDAGAKIIIEERLQGKEVSVLAFCDGQNIAVMPPARDHKRAYDNDEGPNTGGMGAFTPVPEADADFIAYVKAFVLQPVIDGMKSRGTPYVGVLYAGLILTADGPKTLEFNCRFGDPETQVILPLLDSDLYEIMMSCVQGTLHTLDICWKTEACVTIVAASKGYPGVYSKGLMINGCDSVKDAIIFHAGTTYENNQLVTSGGRVLSVSAVGDNLNLALDRAYQALQRVEFDGMFYRKDIGKAL